MINLCSLINFALLLVAGTTHLCAQSAPNNSQFAKPKAPYNLTPYKSPIVLKVEQLVARTKQGYYTAAQNGKPTQKPHSALRTQAGCEDSYLCVAGPLPVTLISFSGTRLEADEVRLSWETSSETDNLGFDVERSVTGTSDFMKVGSVDGSGNTVHTKKYGITDLNSFSNVSYYRLKQVDYDGDFIYSRVIAVDGFREKLSVAAVPNPSPRRDLYLQVKGVQTVEEIELIITDAKGVQIYRNEHQSLNAQRQISLTKIPNLTTGLYQATVISGENKFTVALVIVN